ATEPGAKQRVLLNNREINYIEPAAWSIDGKSIMVSLWKADQAQTYAWVSVSDGSVKPVKSILSWRRAGDPVISPDGQYLAYSALEDPGSRKRNIYILAANGSFENTLIEGSGENNNPVWTPDGSRVFFTSDRTGSLGLWSISVHEGK